jgi:WD40 repeat protein
MSKHLRALKEVGLVEETHPDFDARVRVYSLKSGAVRGLQEWANETERRWVPQLASFKAQLEKEGRKSGFTRLTFWPLRRTYSLVVDGYAIHVRPVAFSPDGKWLATGWPGADGRLRLWPLPGNTVSEVRALELPDATFTIRSLAFDPKGRYLFAVGSPDQAWILPMDGSASWKLQGGSEDTNLRAAAISPSVATAFSYGLGEKSIRMLDLETGELRRFELPASENDATVAGETGTGYDRGVSSLGFADESTLYSAGDGGLRLWNLETGSREIVAAASTGRATRGSFVADRGVAITAEWRTGRRWNDCPRALLHDLGSGVSRELTNFGDCRNWSRFAIALGPSGSIAAIGSLDGPYVLEGSLMGSRISWSAMKGLHRILAGPSLGGDNGAKREVPWVTRNCVRTPFGVHWMRATA